MSEISTIYDLARVAGTSPRTISRFFNHPDLLAPATRDRISRLVEESGFRPSELASRLSTRGRDAVAAMLWVPDGPPSELHQQLLALVAVDLARYGRDLLLIGANQASVDTVVATHFQRRKLGAVLLLNPMPEAVQDAIGSSGVSTVTLNWHPSSTRIRANAYIGIDYNGSMRSFLEAVLVNRYRSLAWIGPLPGDDRRARAACEAADAAGVPIMPVAVPGEAAGWDRLLAGMLGAGIDLAVCWSDTLALALLAAAGRAGVKIPERLALTGFDGIAAGELVHPVLTTVVQPWSLMAARAAECLAQDARHQGEFLVPTTIRRGGTCHFR